MRGESAWGSVKWAGDASTRNPPLCWVAPSTTLGREEEEGEGADTGVDEARGWSSGVGGFTLSSCCAECTCGEKEEDGVAGSCPLAL